MKRIGDRSPFFNPREKQSRLTKKKKACAKNREGNELITWQKKKNLQAKKLVPPSEKKSNMKGTCTLGKLEKDRRGEGEKGDS